ncbi:MAG: hypothetical protein AB7U05_16215 [Mangrovibacterium sp.]
MNPVPDKQLIKDLFHPNNQESQDSNIVDRLKGKNALDNVTDRLCRVLETTFSVFL